MADTGRTVFANDLWAADFWAAGLWAADAPVIVPNVVGNTQAAGTSTLQGAGLAVVVVTAYSSTVAAGLIISQAPAAGASVPPGTTVTITVSLGDAPATNQNAGGHGWWVDYERVQAQRRKRRREIEQAQEANERELQDATDREIAKLLREQELRDADRADLERLQRLADSYAGKALELPKLARIAILNAQDARTRNSLEQMRRVIEQAEEDELLAVQIQILMMAD